MLKIIITGDLCPINRIAELTDNENYSAIYNDFHSILSSSDFNITNLECPLYNGNDSISKSGPSLKVDESFSKILTYGNFHLATLANNHIMDSGVAGLTSTMKSLRNENISIVGAGSNSMGAKKPFLKEINGIKIAVLNFAENEFSTTHGDYPGANPLNVISNFSDIKEVKTKADFVFVIVHGGHEYYELPSPRMQETYRFFVEAGADAVIGHHTHCYSGYELYKEKPIFYSLGNFVFDWPGKRNSVWNKGFAVQFSIENGVLNFNLIPFRQGDFIPGIKLMSENERIEFENNIKNLNAIISEPSLVHEKFLDFAKKQRKDYLTLIQPFSNRILTAVHYRGLLPSFISKKKQRLYLNFIRCEAHRDMLMEILKD